VGSAWSELVQLKAKIPHPDMGRMTEQVFPVDRDPAVARNVNRLRRGTLRRITQMREPEHRLPRPGVGFPLTPSVVSDKFLLHLPRARSLVMRFQGRPSPETAIQ
jgi:hypothetical protein